MKNSANALAPAALCCVASIGSIGGRSDGPVTFGPVVGTSAGTLGVAGAVDVLGADDEVTGVLGTECGGSDDGAFPELPLQPAARQTAAKAAIPAAHRMTRHHARPPAILKTGCGQPALA